MRKYVLFLTVILAIAGVGIWFLVKSVPVPNSSAKIQQDDRPLKAQNVTAAACADRKHTVTAKDGRGLWGVAKKEYSGRGYLYPLIVEKSSHDYPSLSKNPNLIKIGWVLTIPGCLCDLAPLAKKHPRVKKAANHQNHAQVLRKTAKAHNETSSFEMWLDKLIQGESSGRSSIKHLDSNGKYSYGCAQFQQATLVRFSRRYGLLSPSAKAIEIESLLYDCSYQRKLVTLMLEENPANWKHWRNTVRKIGLPPTRWRTPKFPQGIVATLVAGS